MVTVSLPAAAAAVHCRYLGGRPKAVGQSEATGQPEAEFPQKASARARLFVAQEFRFSTRKKGGGRSEEQESRREDSEEGRRNDGRGGTLGTGE